MSNPQSAPVRRRSYWLTITIVLLCVGAAGGYYLYVVNTTKPTPVDELDALRTFLSKIPQGQKLAEAYRDADGNLVADTPSDPAKLQKVSELGFSMIAGDDPEKSEESWKDVLAALEKATGKKVVYQGDLGFEDTQMTAMRNGKLHITAFSTGEVETAVNTAGFVPLCSPADAEGKYSYQMEILVPAASKIQTPADLKGKTIALTILSSNSGAKAPLVILKQKFGLLPGRDYNYVKSGSHWDSIKQLAAGKHDAVCVANDLLARALAAGDIKSEQFRSIYKSDSFPPLCLGIAHDLPPELAAKIKQVFQDFRFAGTSLEKQYRPEGKVGFALVDYKRDWAYVREIDASLTRLLDAK